MTMRAGIETLAESARLQVALDLMAANLDVPGKDQVPVAEIVPDLTVQVAALSAEEPATTTPCVALLRLPITKGGRKKPLVGPTGRDRVVQGALVELACPLVGPFLSKAAWALRTRWEGEATALRCLGQWLIDTQLP